MSLHDTEHAAVELGDSDLRRGFGKKMCDGPEPYSIAEYEEDQRETDDNRSCDESHHT
jgi:hypothetical protein